MLVVEGVGVHWCWMVSSSSMSFCASATPKHLWNVFLFVYTMYVCSNLMLAVQYCALSSEEVGQD